MTSSSHRPVLVVVRAGDRSLHPKWLKGGAKESRNWDLHVSYYGDSSKPFEIMDDDITLSWEKGLKAEGTVECLKKLGDRVQEYDFIWLPDDDLDVTLPVLNRFFEIFQQNNLLLAQPALGPQSFVAHDITRQRAHLRLRYTSFVEIMCPCFSRSAFAVCSPYLGATKSTWGIDLLFPKLLGYPTRGIAIVDETPVIHTRPPMRGENIPLVKKAGVDPIQETWDLVRDFGFAASDVWPYDTLLETYAAIDRNGRLTTDPDEFEMIEKWRWLRSSRPLRKIRDGIRWARTLSRR